MASKKKTKPKKTAKTAAAKAKPSKAKRASAGPKKASAPAKKKAAAKSASRTKASPAKAAVSKVKAVVKKVKAVVSQVAAIAAPESDAESDRGSRKRGKNNAATQPEDEERDGDDAPAHAADDGELEHSAASQDLAQAAKRSALNRLLRI